MKTVQKFIATILITGLILGINLNLFILRPQNAKAVVGIEDTVHDIISEIQDIMGTLKEWGLDGIARFIVKMAMNRLRENIIRWAQGGFRDENQPFAITNWKDFFQEAKDIGSARFIQEFNLTKFCLPFKYVLGESLGLTAFSKYVPFYKEYAACTIDDIVGNAKEFWDNPSISVYGWSAWTALAQPQNNIYGSLLLGAERRAELESEEKEAAQAEAQAGQGYRNETICTEDDVTACKEACAEQGPPSPDCLQGCEQSSIGACLQSNVKNLGSTVHAGLEKVIGSDIDWLISSKEFTDLVEVLVSSLMNKVIFGLGLTGSSGSTLEKTQLEQRAEYSYYKAFQEVATPEKEAKIKSQTLSNILTAIKQINRSTMTCHKEEALKLEMLTRSYADLVQGEAEALYAGINGVDLKPDYEVLDPVVAPYAVYGQSWDAIPFQKYPSKCRGLLKENGLAYNSICKNIRSGLPPFSTDPLCECLFNHDAFACPPAPYPPVSNYNQLSDNILKEKQDFYSSCEAIYIDVNNKCNECLKKAESQCENLEGDVEKSNCFNEVCNNFGDINGVANGWDFYKKCLIEEEKYSCYTCLKEYFMPAGYCAQAGDYTARAIIKYPGTFRKTEKTAGVDWLAPDLIAWVGRWEDGCNDAVPAGGETSVDLICRILPELKSCKTYCPFSPTFTEEQLYDINDDKPNSRDCNEQTTATAGLPAIWAVGNGVFQTRGKCCKAFTGHNPTDYAICAGTETEQQATCTYAKPVEEEPWCYCKDEYRPLGYTRTGGDEKGDRGGDCADFGFVAPDKVVYGYTNNNPGGDVVYIGNSTCKEEQPGEQWDAQAPSDTICEWETTTGKRSEWTCDLRGISGNQYGVLSAGVYHDDPTDTKTGWHLCAPCDPDDEGYSYGTYGTDFNQCTGKVQ